MHSAIIAAEGVSLCMLTVMLYVMLYESRLRNNRDRSFLYLFMTIYAGCAADLLSYWLENAGAGTAILYAVNYLTIVAGGWMGLGFLVYLVFCINENHHVPIWFTWGAYIAVIGVTLSDIVFTACGLLFTFTDGRFTAGPMYSLNVVFQLALPLYCLGFAVYYRRALNRHDRHAIYTYLFLTVGVSTVSQLLDDLPLGYVAAAIACLIVYLLLQARSMRDAAVRESVLTELSNTDALTGLGNRRAAEDVIWHAEGDDGIGTAFFDLNGLKYVNDTQGHKAGDEMIIRFGQMLCQCFPKDEVYHIFGDEFLLLTGPIPRSEFEVHMAQLQTLIDAADSISSVGYAYGPRRNMRALTSQAETLMYADKERCHALHPEWARK